MIADRSPMMRVIVLFLHIVGRVPVIVGTPIGPMTQRSPSVSYCGSVMEIAKNTPSIKANHTIPERDDVV